MAPVAALTTADSARFILHRPQGRKTAKGLIYVNCKIRLRQEHASMLLLENG